MGSNYVLDQHIKGRKTKRCYQAITCSAISSSQICLIFSVNILFERETCPHLTDLVYLMDFNLLFDGL